jgi:hypothetical protein
MGLLPATIKLLAELHRDTGLHGPVVTLGNQDVYASLPDLRALFREIDTPWREPTAIASHTSELFHGANPERSRDYVHARTLFSMFGIEDYADIDAYTIDHPTVIHDLNEPVPEELRGRFGLVIDGGTIEHIFDIRSCFTNVAAMTKVGGRVIHWNSSSNMIDHGFWAINPSAYFDYYSVNGFDDLSATIFEWDTRDPWRPCAAFRYDYGMTINGLCDSERATMVWFTARKAASVPVTIPTQGLYRADRAVPFSGGSWAAPGTPPPRRRLL